MSSSNRKRLSNAIVDLDTTRKAKITLKIISRKDSAGHGSLQIELKLTSNDTKAAKTIPIPAEISAKGSEELIEALERLNQTFVSDMDALWSALRQYHWLKTGKLPQGQEPRKLYISIAEDMLKDYAEQLTKAMNKEDVKSCIGYVNDMQNKHRAQYIQALRDKIDGIETPHPYWPDAFEARLVKYRADIRDAFRHISAFLSDRRDVMFSSNGIDEAKWHAADEENAQLTRLKKTIDEALCAFEDAWLDSAMDIRNQAYISMPNAKEHSERVRNAIAGAWREYRKFKAETGYLQDGAPGIADDSADYLKAVLLDMGGEQSKELADPVRMREIVTGSSASKSARQR